MALSFRNYKDSDWPVLLRLMCQFWEELVLMDPQRRFIHPSDYGEVYCKEMLKKIELQSGELIWAEIEGEIAGLIVIVQEAQSAQNRVEVGEEKIGRILEIYVVPELRGKGLGRALFREGERRLIASSCNCLKVEVFRYNKHAHGFYRALGYHDCLIDLYKRV